jgi:hypothetical protein
MPTTGGKCGWLVHNPEEGEKMALETQIASLEGKIEGLTGVIERFLATQGGEAPAAATTGAGAATTPRRGRPPGTGKTKTLTADDAKAAAFKVRDAISMDAAKKIIKKHGAAELAKLEPASFAAFISDCEAAVAEAEGEAGEEESTDL